jgi:hypothetical protein
MMAPEEKFVLGIPDLLHGRLTLANRFARFDYFSQHQEIPLWGKVPRSPSLDACGAAPAFLCRRVIINL